MPEGGARLVVVGRFAPAPLANRARVVHRSGTEAHAATTPASNSLTVAACSGAAGGQLAPTGPTPNGLATRPQRAVRNH